MGIGNLGQRLFYIRTRWLMLWLRQKSSPRSWRKGAFIECIQWRDSRCTMVLTAWGCH